MTNSLILLITSIVSALVFIYFIVTGIVRKKLRQIIFSLFFLCISIASFFFLGVHLTSKATSKLKETISDVKENFRPRTGSEIYFALFGKPAYTCVKVINHQDQIVPRLDCCIWLEFETCPSELNRIIKQQSFKSNKYHSIDTLNYIPDYSPRPKWCKPNFLNNSIIVLRDYDFDNPNRDKILVFSEDSSRAFYCDMAD